MRQTVTLLVLVAASFVVAPSSAFANPCDAQRGAAGVALTNAYLPAAAHRHLYRTLTAAWRVYGLGSQGSADRAAALLREVGGTLADGGPADPVPSERRDEVRNAFEELASCVAFESMATVPVRVQISLPPSSDTAAAPSPDGVSIRVDGEAITSTNTAGSASLALAAGPHEITAEKEPDLRGTTHVMVRQSPPLAAAIDVVLRRVDSLASEADVRLDEARDGLLARDFKSVSLQFIDDSGKALVIAAIRSIELQSESDVVDVRTMFSVTLNGVVRLTAVEPFRKRILEADGTLTLGVAGIDRAGRELRGDAQFAVARHRASVTVVLPPGGGLPPRVRATSRSTGLSFWAVVNAAHVAEFTALPDGQCDFAAEMVSNGERYFARTSINITGDVAGRLLFPEHVETRRVTAAASAASATELGGDAAQIDTRDPYRDFPRDTRPAPRAASVTVVFTKDGGIKPILYHEYLGSAQFTSASEADLEAARAAEAKRDPDSDLHVLVVRLFDAAGKVLYRSVVTYQTASVVEGHRWVVRRPFAIIEFPEVSDARLEITASTASASASYQISTLRNTAELRSGELLDRQEP